jgi:hypothetical protein
LPQNAPPGAAKVARECILQFSAKLPSTRFQPGTFIMTREELQRKVEEAQERLEHLRGFL